jgi:dipeptidyl aminopeptidase/acylaminoacyl peptidase
VPRAESIQIRDAMKKAGKKVEYVEYADEGHGFARPENRLAFFGIAEKFLAEHIGGRAEQ